MIYLDNASTTLPSEKVKEAVENAMNNFGNPSSMHRLGIDAENIIKNAKENAATILSVAPNNIYFTSGGTESNNTAILGCCRANAKKGTHIITTKIEHPSVLAPFKILESEGFSVTYLSVDKNGLIDTGEFFGTLNEQTIFVSVMLVNNEIGSIMPIEKLKNLMQKKAPKALLHTDAVQGFGKISCKPKQYGVDLLSASAHKIHGIKGTGLLYIADNVNIKPFVVGGGQQKNMRSGTENVVGIAGFGAACSQISQYDSEHIKNIRNLLKNGIISEIERVKINEATEDRQAPHILNVSFSGIKAEILLHSLETHGIYVSTGSACSSNKPSPSHVLSAIGCTKDEIEGAVRFSFSNDITKSDIETTIEALKTEVAKIRKYTRK